VGGYVLPYSVIWRWSEPPSAWWLRLKVGADGAMCPLFAVASCSGSIAERLDCVKISEARER
jgi:hypothetical protein